MEKHFGITLMINFIGRFLSAKRWPHTRFPLIIFISFFAIQSSPTEAAQEDTTSPGKPLNTIDENNKDIPQTLQKTTEQKRMDLLAGDLSDENIIWIDAPNDRFMATYYPENLGTPAGALIIFYSLDNYGQQLKAAQEIHHSLPNHGWFTLGIPIQAKPPIKDTPKSTPIDPPPTTNDASQDNNANSANQSDDSTTNNTNATEKMPDTKPIEVNPIRIRKAIEHFQKLGIFNVVIVASSETAPVIYSYLSDHFSGLQSDSINAIQGLITINQINNTNKDLYEPTSTLIKQMPILDIYYGKSRHTKILRAERKRMVTRHQFLNYQQISIPRTASSIAQKKPLLPSRIRAWLNRYAKGSVKRK